MTSPRSDRFASLLAFAVPLAVYAVSAHRDVGYWDVGEMDTVPWILGIAHPTAFPAYVLIGWVWSHALTFGSVAFRMSLLSAAGVSVAAWCAGRVVRDAWPDDPWLGTGCAWLFAFGVVTWSHATRAEVHALAIALLALTMLLTLRWYRYGNRRDALAAAIVCGVGVAVHPIVASALLAAVLPVAARRSARTYRLALFAAALGVGAFAIWFVYLPLRSAYVASAGADPTRALGVRAGAPFWDYDHPAVWPGFLALVTGADFGVGNAAQVSPAGAVYAARLPRFFTTLPGELTWPGLLIAIAGAIVAWRRDRWRAGYVLACGALPVPFVLGFAAESDVERYFLPLFLAATIFAGDGLGAAALRWPRARETAVAIPMLLAAWLIAQQGWLFAQPRDLRARATIAEVQALTPPDAIVIATWPYATPLAYAAYVEGLMGARIVVAGWPADERTEIAGWTKTRAVYVLGIPPAPVPRFGLERESTREPLFRLVPAK